MDCSDESHQWRRYGSYRRTDGVRVPRLHCARCGKSSVTHRGAPTYRLKKGARLINDQPAWEKYWTEVRWHFDFKGLPASIRYARELVGVHPATGSRWVSAFLRRDRVPPADCDTTDSTLREALRDYRSRRGRPRAESSRASHRLITAEVDSLRAHSTDLWRSLVRAREIAAIVTGRPIPSWTSLYRGETPSCIDEDGYISSRWDQLFSNIGESDVAESIATAILSRSLRCMDWAPPRERLSRVANLVGTREWDDWIRERVMDILLGDPAPPYRWGMFDLERFLKPIGIPFDSIPDLRWDLIFTVRCARDMVSRRELLLEDQKTDAGFRYFLRFTGHRMMITVSTRHRVVGRAYTKVSAKAPRPINIEMHPTQQVYYAKAGHVEVDIPIHPRRSQMLRLNIPPDVRLPI